MPRAALLRLLQLCSPTLPIGTFAYSQALEPAVAAGWVHDEVSAAAWIGGLLNAHLAVLDLPILRRLHDAWGAGDEDAVSSVSFWNALLYASRATAELQAEERQLGSALARVLHNLGLAEAGRFAEAPRDDVTYAAMFALAACRWEIPVAAACDGYAFAWAEAQVSAAVRLVPLGQSAGQRILAALGAAIPAAVTGALAMSDEDIGAIAPGHAIASARHETQYSRLFRS